MFLRKYVIVYLQYIGYMYLQYIRNSGVYFQKTYPENLGIDFYIQIL